MSTLCLITEFPPMADDPLPAPVVVATITTDKRFIRGADASKLLGHFAARLGLMQYSIIDGEAQSAPGVQLDLFRPKS